MTTSSVDGLNLFPYGALPYFSILHTARVCPTCGVKVKEVPWAPPASTHCAMPTCYTLHSGLGSYRGRKRQRVSTPVGIMLFSVQYVVEWGWSIVNWVRFVPLASIKSSTGMVTNVYQIEAGCIRLL